MDNKHFIGATRVYMTATGTYFIEKDGTLRALHDREEAFTPSPGWYVWKVTKSGELYDRKVLIA